jgi:hypothetical protein
MFRQFRERVETVDFKERVPHALRPVLRWVHRRLRTALEFHKYQALLTRNRELLRRQPRPERCFIIANGPSIKGQDLTLLRGETTFVMNSFFLHADYERIRPTYHCAIDPLLVADTPSNIAWLRDLERRKGETALLFSVDGHDLFQKQGLFSGRDVYYTLHCEQGCDTGRISCDLTRPLPSITCVTLSCILTAVYLGCPEIYLLGFDHDWLGTPTTVGHFYDSNPHYSGSIAMYPYETLLEYTLALWRGYRRVRQFAFDRGTKIFNATKGGFLDVFPRVEYEKIIAQRPGADPASAPPVGAARDPAGAGRR